MDLLKAVTSPNKTDSSCPSSHPLSIVPQLWVELHDPFYMHAGVASSLILYKSCPCSHSWFKFMSTTALSCPANVFIFFSSSTILSFFQLLSLLLQCPLSFERSVYDIDDLIRAELSEVSEALHVGQERVSVLIAIYYNKKPYSHARNTSTKWIRWS